MIVLNTMSKINFFSYRKYFFTFSIALTIVTSILFFTKGLNFGIDFKGGAIIEFLLNDQCDAEHNLRELNVEFSRTKDTISVLTGSTKLEEVEDLKRSLKKGCENIEFSKVDFIGPKVSKALIHKGAIALILSLVAIACYIFIRFNIRYSISAIISLTHDIVAIFAVFLICQIPLDLTTLAATLTVMGYSINDSVVIFDRMREKSTLKKSVAITSEIINESINETLSRTIMTFLTTFVACISLWLYGGENLKNFSTIIILGIIFGTYSSICISANVMVYLNRYDFKKIL